MLSKYLFLAALAISGVYSSTRDAQVHVLTHDAPVAADASSSRSISPAAARLVLAHRFGVSKYHRLDDASDDSIDAINAYGGVSPSFFEESEESCMRKAVVVIEGVHDPAAMSSWQTSEAITFSIHDTPATDLNKRFLSDLSSQARHIRSCHSLGSLAPKLRIGSNSLHLYGGDHAFVHVTALQTIEDDFGIGSKQYKAAAASIKQELRRVHDTFAGQADHELIVVFVPPHKHSGSIFKRTTSSYGKYIVPRREDSDVPEHYHPEAMPGPAIVASLPAVEDVSNDDVTVSSDSGLSLLESLVTAAAADAYSNSSSNSSSPSSNSSSSPIPRGILPACYSTLETCQRITLNCTGHGSCQRSYTYSSGDRDVSCFACKCAATHVRTESGGNQTTRWAGPACQKQDVSVPFWLLGGTTVGLVSVMAWGIGLLYAMGSQDLPSVIGAGVAGPRAR